MPADYFSVMQPPSPRRFERASRFWLAAFQNLNIGVATDLDDVATCSTIGSVSGFCQIGLPKEWISNVSEALRTSGAIGLKRIQECRQSESL